MSASGIGSKVTFDANVAHLSEVGLIKVRSIAGEHIGNEYTVFLPEELTETLPSQTSETGQTGYTQKLARLVSLETRQTRYTLNPEESDISGTSNTFLNTCTDDDDTHMVRAFSVPVLEAAKELTGGAVSASEDEKERWRECGKVLAEELKNAARNTTAPISSIPAFLSAHLRRRFARLTKPVESTDQPEKKAESGSAQTRSVQPTHEVVTAVMPGSKFSLEQCRDYADHLQKSGQGIINPGGYAKTIWRSGEADSFIEEFVSKKETVTSLNDKLCPDCKGTGIKASEGEEPSDVACTHPRLEIATRLFDHVEQLRQIHANDPGYEESHMMEDLRYRVQKEGVEWGESLASFLINLNDPKGTE